MKWINFKIHFKFFITDSACVSSANEDGEPSLKYLTMAKMTESTFRNCLHFMAVIESNESTRDINRFSILITIVKSDLS